MKKYGVNVQYKRGDRFVKVTDAETGVQLNGITDFDIHQSGGDPWPTVTIEFILNELVQDGVKVVDMGDAVPHPYHTPEED